MRSRPGIVQELPTPLIENRLVSGLRKESALSKLLRAVVAGAGAWKWGGGCISTILIFIVLWWLLGNIGIFR
jgi:hypothetical protein